MRLDILFVSLYIKGTTTDRI